MSSRSASNGCRSRKNDVSLVASASTTSSRSRARPCATGRPARRTEPRPSRCTSGASRVSTRYSLPSPSDDGAVVLDELADVLEVGRRTRACQRPADTRRARTAARSSSGTTASASPASATARGHAGDDRARLALGHDRAPGSAHRPRARKAVVAHPGQHHGEHPGPVDIGRGAEQHVRRGPARVLGRPVGQLRRRPPRRCAPGPCGARRVRCTRGPRRPRPRRRPRRPGGRPRSSRSASDPVKSGGMCWTIRTGTARSAGSARDDRREGVGAAGGHRDHDRGHRRVLRRRGIEAVRRSAGGGSMRRGRGSAAAAQPGRSPRRARCRRRSASGRSPSRPARAPRTWPPPPATSGG